MTTRGIMKEMLSSNADRIKFEPNLKGWIKNGGKYIIDMDSQEAHIISDEAESWISMLTDWSLVNNQREVKDILSLCLSAVGTCIVKLKPLVEKVKNKKQRSLDRNAPTCKAIFLWFLKLSLRLHIMTVGYAHKNLVEKKIIKTK